MEYVVVVDKAWEEMSVETFGTLKEAKAYAKKIAKEDGIFDVTILDNDENIIETY